MRRGCLIGILAGLLVAPPAARAAIAPLSVNEAYWIAHARAPLPADVTLSGGDVATACANPDVTGVVACSLPGTSWLGPSPDRVAFWHELGHQLDFQYSGMIWPDPDTMTPWQQRFMQIWGLTGGWWDYLPGTGGGSPGEWFASAYADCAMGDQYYPRSWAPELDWAFDFPSGDRGKVIASCWLIRGL